MDYRRHDIDQTLHLVRQGLAQLHDDLQQGPAPRWVDADGRTAVEHWASWGLCATRDLKLSLSVLHRADLRSLLTDSEVTECDSHRKTVADAHATFTAAGGLLLPVDVPDP